jgi:hypothetical protein
MAALLADLAREIGTLVRDEVALARVEMSGKIAQARRHAMLLAGGAAVASVGLLTLVGAAVLVLVAAGLPPWGAALVVGVGLSALGALAMLRGVSGLRDADLKPTETIRSLKETAAWKRQTS